MNNRTQQRFDRSIREAIAITKRATDMLHAIQQAYAEEARRNTPLAPEKIRRKSNRVSQADQLRAYDALAKVKP